MKRFLIDFIIAFFIIISLIGVTNKGESKTFNENYLMSIKDNEEKINNIEEYDDNKVNLVFYKISNGLLKLTNKGIGALKEVFIALLE